MIIDVSNRLYRLLFAIVAWWIINGFFTILFSLATEGVTFWEILRQDSKDPEEAIV